MKPHPNPRVESLFAAHDPTAKKPKAPRPSRAKQAKQAVPAAPASRKRKLSSQEPEVVAQSNVEAAEKNADGAEAASNIANIQNLSLDPAAIGQTKAFTDLRFLDLSSDNPILTYNNQTYSCHWASSIGTDILFTKPPAEADTPKNYKPLRSFKEVDILGFTTAKLVAEPATLEPKVTAAKVQPVAPPNNGANPNLENEELRQQLSFLSQLADVRKKRGETVGNLKSLAEAAGAGTVKVPRQRHPGDKNAKTAAHRSAQKSQASSVASSSADVPEGEGSVALGNSKTPSRTPSRRTSSASSTGTDASVVVARALERRASDASSAEGSSGVEITKIMKTKSTDARAGAANSSGQSSESATTTTSKAKTTKKKKAPEKPAAAKKNSTSSVAGGSDNAATTTKPETTTKQTSASKKTAKPVAEANTDTAPTGDQMEVALSDNAVDTASVKATTAKKKIPAAKKAVASSVAEDSEGISSKSAPAKSNTLKKKTPAAEKTAKVAIEEAMAEERTEPANTEAEMAAIEDRKDLD